MIRNPEGAKKGQIKEALKNPAVGKSPWPVTPEASLFCIRPSTVG